MVDEEVKRKLTAILSADVAGYSRLMDDDEAATVRTITAYRSAMAALIQQHRGRVVDTTGDNLLAEFASAVDAVNCAVEIQRDLAERNAELSYERKMEFRIGVNVGDVIEEEDRIYGDGVNIAARMEGLADAGGICISGRVYDQVENKLDLEFEYKGEQSVKNIAKPIRVYRVLSTPGAAAHRVIQAKAATEKKWRKAGLAIAAMLILAIGTGLIWKYYLDTVPARVEPASMDKMAFPLPDKPSIAVLPFSNMTGDPNQEYICDGISDQIITSLSMTPRLFVIARNSSFTYKYKVVKVKQVAEELGVRYVLEGSVQKSGEKLRILVQLIDAIEGYHIWSERYDKELKDVFDLQDEIAMKLGTAIQVNLTNGEYAAGVAATTSNLKALECYWQAEKHILRQTKEDNASARRWTEKAIEFDPEFSAAWALLGYVHLFEYYYDWGKSREHSLKLAEECARKALDINNSTAKAWRLMSDISLTQKHFDEGLECAKKAITLSPSDPFMLEAYVKALMSVGRHEEAVITIKKAMRLSPYYPAYFLNFFCRANFLLGRYEVALAGAKQLMDRCEKGEISCRWPHLFLAMLYSELGREKEARAHAAELLKINPNFATKNLMKIFTIKNQRDKERILNACRNAGLPETPPPPLPDKPSIAVLPLKNISDDPEQEAFADGMTDDLITDLSKISGLFVIASNTVFTYKGKSVKVEEIGRKLGVRYVLEGSVRRAENQVRINVQLIDTKTGGHLWAERFDGNWENIFALQDKITNKITSALVVKLTDNEQEQFARKGTDSTDAYDAFLKGRGHHIRYTSDDIPKAVVYYKKAIELDPNYGQAYAALSNIHFFDSLRFLSLPPHEARIKAHEYLKMAMENPTYGAYNVSAAFNLYLGMYDEAIADAERALALAPNDPAVHSMMALVLNGAGRPKEAAEFAKLMMRYDPGRIGHSLYHLGSAYFGMGKLEQAVTYFERSRNHTPGLTGSSLHLLAAYAHLGRNQEAQAALENSFFTIRPGLRSVMGMNFKFNDPEYNERLASGLLKAGLPGEPSGYYKIYEKNMLREKEIKELVLGAGANKWWIESDMLCSKWPFFDKCCFPVFRNPDRTPEGKNDYLLVTYTGIITFSTVQEIY